MDAVPVLIAALAVGIVASAYATAIGGGGAIVSTPALRAIGVSSFAALGTTIPAVILAALIGTVKYSRQGLIDWRTTWIVGAGGFAGATLGALVATRTDGRILMLVTAALMAANAVKMFTSRNTMTKNLDAGIVDGAPWRSTPKCIALGVAGGAMAGLLGIGGGLVILPALVSWLRMPLKSAIGTSLAAVAMISIPALGIHAYAGSVNWPIATALVLGSVVGAPIGARILVRVDAKKLVPVVAAVLLIASIAFVAHELRTW